MQTEIGQLTTRAIGRARDVQPMPSGFGWLVNVSGVPRSALYPCPVLVRDGDEVELRGYDGNVLAEHVIPRRVR